MCVESNSQTQTCKRRLRDREKLAALWTWAEAQEGFEKLLEARIHFEDALVYIEDGRPNDAAVHLIKAIDIQMQPMAKPESQTKWREGIRSKDHSFLKSRMHLYRLLVLLADCLETLAMKASESMQQSDNLSLLGAAQWSLEVADVLGAFGGDETGIQRRGKDLALAKIRHSVLSELRRWDFSRLKELVERHKIPCEHCSTWESYASVLADNNAMVFGGFDNPDIVGEESGSLQMVPRTLTAAKLHAWLNVDLHYGGASGGIRRGDIDNYWSGGPLTNVVTGEGVRLNGSLTELGGEWKALSIEPGGHQNDRAQVVLLSSATQEFLVRSQCSLCLHEPNGLWYNRRCMQSKTGLLGSMQVDPPAGADSVHSLSPSHVMGVQLFPNDVTDDHYSSSASSSSPTPPLTCRQVLEVKFGRRPGIDATSEEGSVWVSAVSKTIRGIPGKWPRKPSSKPADESHQIYGDTEPSARFSVDNHGIEFHCRSVSQGVIAIDLSFRPVGNHAPLALYYAWEELPLPLSGIEYTRMVGVVTSNGSGPSRIDAERIWAPAHGADDRPLRTLCISVHALSNHTSAYDIAGVPYYQNPYAAVFDVVKGTDWERNKTDIPDASMIQVLVSPPKHDYMYVRQSGHKLASRTNPRAPQPHASVVDGVDDRSSPSSSPSSSSSSPSSSSKSSSKKYKEKSATNSGTSKSGSKQKRNARSAFQRDDTNDVRRDLQTPSLASEVRDRPLVPLLLMLFIAGVSSLLHWKSIAKAINTMMRESDRKLSDSVAKKRHETPELIALRAAMLDGTDSSKLARAIRNAELQLESVSAAVIRRARTMLSERRRLEKLAEVQRKKAAARNRSMQEAAARIAVKQQEEKELAKKEAEKASHHQRHLNGNRIVVSGGVMCDENDMIDSPSSSEDVIARVRKEEEDLNLAIQESLAAARKLEDDAASTTLDADEKVRVRTSSRDVSSEDEDRKQAKISPSVRRSVQDSSLRDLRKQDVGNSRALLGDAKSAANRQQHDITKVSGRSIPSKRAQSQSTSADAVAFPAAGSEVMGRGRQPHMQPPSQRLYQPRQQQQQQQQQRLSKPLSTKDVTRSSLQTHDVPYLSSSDETNGRGGNSMHGTAASFYRTEAHAMKQQQQYQAWITGSPATQKGIPPLDDALRQQQHRRPPVAYSAASPHIRHAKSNVASLAAAAELRTALTPPEKGLDTRYREIPLSSHGEEHASPALVSHAASEPDALHHHSMVGYVGHHPLRVPSAEYHDLRTDSSSSSGTTHGSVDASKLSPQHSMDTYDVDSGTHASATAAASTTTTTGDLSGSNSSDRMFEGIVKYVLPDDIFDDSPIAAPSQRRSNRHRDVQEMLKPEPSRHNGNNAAASSEFFSWNNHFNSIFGGRGIRSMWGSSGVHKASSGSAAAAADTTMTNGDAPPAGLPSMSLWERSDSGSSTASSNVRMMAPDMTHIGDSFLYSYDVQQQRQRQEPDGWQNTTTSTSSVSAQLDRIGVTRHNSGHDRYSNSGIGADLVDDDTMKRFSRSPSL